MRKISKMTDISFITDMMTIYRKTDIKNADTDDTHTIDPSLTSTSNLGTILFVFVIFCLPLVVYLTNTDK